MATATTTGGQARRGDLVVLQRPVPGGGTRATLGVATAVTRQGEVRMWANPALADHAPLPCPVPTGPDHQTVVFAQEHVDVPAAMGAYRERARSSRGSGGRITPLGSLQEAKDLLRPFRTGR